MSVDQQPEVQADGIILTEVAARKVSDLAASEGEDGLSLRISVAPGGCSGLRYQLALDDRELDGDVEKEWYGVKVVTERMSAPYLAGATIDFVDSISPHTWPAVRAAPTSGSST